MAEGTIYKFYKDLPTWSKGVSVVIVMLIVGMIAWKINKWLKNRPPHVTYPQGGKGIPKGFDPRPYAKLAHDSMLGASVLVNPARDSILSKILDLPTDDMFVSVYDAFNQMYMKDGDGTFKQWINDEWFAPGLGLNDKFNKRFDRLNLK